MMDKEKMKIISRLKRIEGQIRGIQRLIEEDAPCGDILTQVSAVTAAVKKTGAVLISTHMETCLKEKNGNKGKERDEFYRALTRFIDLS